MNEKETVVGTHSLITIGSACAVLAFLVGGVWWAADTNAVMRYQSEQIVELRADVREIKGQLDLIRRSVASNSVSVK